ncbi:hypothetical protein MC7420_4857 [Coleofasciculus chthonoplastes PCC 7420]|uniref:DUF4123 domain-containing protein n=1 Tax=Coleofasciculus chthonoplastes PCC 7420 TaxID=118168 RepID=B4VNJ9_9CYAN|nr:DUF4123 domain-containing protein [Coleofasciculus chthonoplastes]EDX76601.1 hypothetical protein MC7420_4857 [Coleofasciculus chthonoplastes PCC 7420]
MPNIDVQKIIEQLWSSIGQSQNVYALLDAACDVWIYPTLKVLVPNSRYRCLCKGKSTEDLKEVLPYLVQFKKEEDFTCKLIERGWAKSFVIFIEV